MRRDFRVKIDFSKIYIDARRFSWVFVDSSKILYVHELAHHIQKLFDIEKPFHLLSKFEETHLFLPFDEDVRILENNDTVMIVPGTGFVKCVENGEASAQTSLQNGFKEPFSYSKMNNVGDSERSYTFEKSSIHNTLETSDTISMGDTFYRTALHETAVNGEDLKTTDDNFTEDTSVTEDLLTSKKKRIRKRPKHKKQMSTTAESDASPIQPSVKKPKIVDSVLLPSGKHIRFKGIEDEDKAMDEEILHENNVAPTNGRVGIKPGITKDLNALLSLRQSSTPLTFSHKRVKKEFKPEVIDESKMSTESDHNVADQPNLSISSNRSTSHSGRYHENSGSSLNDILNSTITFKVFRIAEDYTPQLSDFILAQVLSINCDESKCTLKVIEGIEQLKDPQGKFSLPKDDDEDEDDSSDILTLEISKLIDLKTVKALNH